MTMTRGEAVSSRSGSGRLNSTPAAVAWLAITAADLGDPVRAEQVVLPGALGPMVPVVADDRFRAEVTGLVDDDVAFAGPAGQRS